MTQTSTPERPIRTATTDAAADAQAVRTATYAAAKAAVDAQATVNREVNL